jgi:hypothetical protein
MYALLLDRGGKNFLLCLLFLLAQNNPNAKVAYLGRAYFDPFINKVLIKQCCGLSIPPKFID